MEPRKRVFADGKLSDSELEKAQSFLDTHRECRKAFHSRSFGAMPPEVYSYRVSGCSAGLTLYIICDECSEEENITDYSLW